MPPHCCRRRCSRCCRGLAARSARSSCRTARCRSASRQLTPLPMVMPQNLPHVHANACARECMPAPRPRDLGLPARRYGRWESRTLPGTRAMCSSMGIARQEACTAGRGTQERSRVHAHKYPCLLCAPLRDTCWCGCGLFNLPPQTAHTSATRQSRSNQSWIC